MRTAATLLFTCTALLIAGCGTDAPSPTTDQPGPTGLPQELTGTWEDDRSAGVQFQSDGDVTGYDGCNDFTGTWTSSGDHAIELDITRPDEHECVVGPTLMLTKDMTWSRNGRELTLTSSDDNATVLHPKATGGMG